MIVDVLAVNGHTGKIVLRDSHGQKVWQPQCVCGWSGPGYPENDYGSAEIGLKAHAGAAAPLESQFFTEIRHRNGKTVRQQVVW